MSYTRTQLEDWLKIIEIKGGKVLDIGGSQLPLSSKRLGVFEPEEYKILDLEQPHECKKEPDYIHDLNEYIITGIREKNETDIKRFIQFENNEVESEIFDIAFCLEVTEYWWNPAQALKNINWFVKQGGILYISFHFWYPCHNPVDQDYLRYTPTGCQKLLEEAGFEIVDMQPRLMTQDITRIDGMRPAKNYDKHSWSGCLIKAMKI